MPRKTLGKFEVVSGKVRVTDPCYDEETWCAGTVDKVRNGIWAAEVTTSKYERVSTLLAHFGGYKPKSGAWISQAYQVGVDSGQAGLFDEKNYRKSNAEDEAKITSHWAEFLKKEKKSSDPQPAFYAVCCSLTCGDDNGASSFGGVLKHGCVSSSGWGDGCYAAFVQRDSEGKAVAIKIKF